MYETILTDIKGEVKSKAVMIGAFHTSLTSVDRPSRKKIDKETATLPDPLDGFN